MIYSRVKIESPFAERIRAILCKDYDLLIKLGRAPAGDVERVAASTDVHLLRRCPCPVWIDQFATTGSCQTVLAGVDSVTESGEGCSDRGAAASVSQGKTAPLAVVHVWHLCGETMLRSGRGSASTAKVKGFVSPVKD